MVKVIDSHPICVYSAVLAAEYAQEMSDDKISIRLAFILLFVLN